MKSRLDQIEHRLQSFIENSLFFFPWSNHQTLFSHQLVDAIQRTLNQDAYGNFTPGQVFSISANPEMVLPWQTDPDFLPTLSKILFDAAADAGLSFSSLPEFKLIADPSIPPGKLRIEPFESHKTVEETGVMSIQIDESKEPVHQDAINPFLILYGNQVYPLRLGVINLGRRDDNQIVIDDPRVSRSHAQLRAIRGQYILCDLNSTGGTFVNGQRITQSFLRPGDVISLAGIDIIYGEETYSDSHPTNGDTSEIPLNPPRP
jgi:pSer/pThr/pTyr-binding forkhead associated (FHA) protein